MALRRLQVLAFLADELEYARRNALQGETDMPFYEKGDVRIRYEGLDTAHLGKAGIRNLVSGLAGSNQRNG